MNFLIGELPISVVDACFSSSGGYANLHRISDKNLKIYRITIVLIKINVLNNLSESEFSIGHGFVKVHDAA